jgi:hypothetical protein
MDGREYKEAGQALTPDLLLFSDRTFQLRKKTENRKYGWGRYSFLPGLSLAVPAEKNVCPTAHFRYYVELFRS